MKPVIICCGVKNEEANLRRVLPAWELFANHIVLADQFSEDNTREVASHSPKVTLIENNDKDYNEKNRNTLLVNKAREIASNAILLYLDADEVPSANILHSPEWTMFCKSPEGTTGYLRWIQVWKTPYQYISSGYTNSGSMPFFFVDDGRSLDNMRTMHGSRGVGMEDPSRIFMFSDVVVLHLAGLNFARTEKKQNWYKIWWTLKGGPFHHTNINHNWIYNVKSKNLSPAEPEWYDAYKHKNIDITSVEYKQLEWYDLYALAAFKKHGEKAFYLLDIWYGVDWEHLRQKAIELGKASEVPTNAIIPPKGSIKIIQKLIYNRYNFGSLPKRLFRRIGLAMTYFLRLSEKVRDK